MLAMHVDIGKIYLPSLHACYTISPRWGHDHEMGRGGRQQELALPLAIRVGRSINPVASWTPNRGCPINQRRAPQTAATRVPNREFWFVGFFTTRRSIKELLLDYASNSRTHKEHCGTCADNAARIGKRIGKFHTKMFGYVANYISIYI